MNIAPNVLRAAYRGGWLKPSEVMAHVLSRLSEPDQSGVWISTAGPDAAMAAAEALDRRIGEIEALPLYGLVFSVKDFIDVEGEPTTAACPEFSYVATASSPVVAMRSGPARSMSARPIWTSSRPVWSACVLRMVSRAIRIIRPIFPADRVQGPPYRSPRVRRRSPSVPIPADQGGAGLLLRHHRLQAGTGRI
jgi:hypothetical protein